MESVLEWIERYGYVAIFGLLMLGIVGLPVPDETLLLFAGYLSFKGDLNLEATLATAFSGSICGISLSYALGRMFGTRAVVKLAPWLHIRPEDVTTTIRWLARWGKYALLIAYFIPGIRHLAALVVGAALLPTPTFARFAYTGAALWCGTFIGIGYVTGEEWQLLSSFLHRTLMGTALLLLVLGSLAWWWRRKSAI
jgi:membrane protein DedA with SNARE-associated domain